MLTISEQKFLQDKDLTGFASGYSRIKSGKYLFKASGIRKNNIITRIKLDGLEGFAQYLYIYEWEILEGFLLSNLPTNCKYIVEGVAIRSKDSIGTLDITSLHIK